MKRKFLSLVMALVLMMACAVPVAAESVSEDPVVQSAYDTYCTLKTAVEADDFGTIVATVKTLETTTESMTDEQVSEWNTVVEEKGLMEEYLVVVITASYIKALDETYNAYVADQNIETIVAFVTIYEQTKNDIGVPLDTKYPAEITDAYKEAKANMPSSKVLEIVDAYLSLEDAVDEAITTEDASAIKYPLGVMKAYADKIETLRDDELKDLAEILGTTSGEQAVEMIGDLYFEATNIYTLYEAMAAYYENPTEDSAQAMVDAYEAIVEANLIDEKTLNAIFGDSLDSAYEDALKTLGGNGGEEGEVVPAEPEPEPEKDKTPETGDDFNVMVPLAALLASAAAAAVALRRRAQ